MSDVGSKGIQVVVSLTDREWQYLQDEVKRQDRSPECIMASALRIYQMVNVLAHANKLDMAKLVEEHFNSLAGHTGNDVEQG